MSPTGLVGNFPASPDRPDLRHRPRRRFVCAVVALDPQA